MAKRNTKKKTSSRARAKTKKKASGRSKKKSVKSKKKTAAKAKKRSATASKSKKKAASKTSARKTSARKISPKAKKRHVATEEPPRLVPVPLPEGVRSARPGDSNERSAHLDKLKQLFDSAPISRYLGMSLGYCENGVARVRLPFRKDFEEGHGVIHGGLIGLLGDTAGNFAVGSVSPGSTVKTVEFKLSLLAGVQGDLLAIGEVVRKGRTLATCRLEVVEGNDRVVAIGLATYALQAV
jgi:uncharacterized protein (TIGR00369 family)